MRAGRAMTRPAPAIAALMPALVPALLLLGGCGHRDDRIGTAPAPVGWRVLATAADRTRIRGWRDAWVQGLAKVTAPAERMAVARQGVLLQPDAGLLDPAPPPGDYRCRMTKIGAKDQDGRGQGERGQSERGQSGQGQGTVDYVAYPAFSCRITRAAGALDFAKLDGSQRPAGRLFPDDGGRLVFLGTMILGDERRGLDYGRDPERDVAGVLERIGPRRWRLVMPFPHWESTIDVLELVPADA